MGVGIPRGRSDFCMPIASLDGDFAADAVESWKGQYTCWQLRFDGLGLDQSCPAPGKVPAKHTSDVEQRATAANQASILRTVSDAIALGAQDSVLQANCIERSELSTSVRR